MKKIIGIILIVLSIASIIFVYNDDFLYNKKIIKVEKIETVQEEVLQNDLGLKEKYYTKSTSYSRAGSGGTDSSIVIRVRAYKVTKGKKVFGKWSNRKKVNGYYAWSD